MRVSTVIMFIGRVMVFTGILITFKGSNGWALIAIGLCASLAAGYQRHMEDN